MTISIAYDDQTIYPDLVLNYRWERASRNNVHTILDDPNPVVTLRPAAPRSGTLALFFATEAAALDAEDAHALATVFVLADTDHPGLGMRYVVNGSIRVTQDDEKPEWWTVEVAFQEVAP